jgi:hypothetical protein
MLQGKNVVEKCNSRFQEIFGNYNINADGKVIVSHFGEFSQDLVNSLSTSIEDMMIESGDKKGTVKRMFSILVEGLQNIRIHGGRDKDGNQVSFLLIRQTEESYKATLANLVVSDNISTIEKRINELNQLELPAIKELYMEVLSNGIMSNKGGAGLGFITMALKSKNKLVYVAEDVSENLHFLSLEITIDRIKKD